MFSVVAVIVKLIPEASLGQLILLRYAAQWLMSIPLIAYGRANHGLKPLSAIGSTIVWSCSAAYFSMIVCLWGSCRRLPVGDAVVLTYLAPIFTMVLSRVVLGDPFRRTYPLYILLGTAGAVMVIQPSALFGARERDLDVIGVCLAVCAAFSGACMQVLMHRAKRAHWLVHNSTMSFLCAFVFAPIFMMAQLMYNGGFMESWIYSWKLVYSVGAMSLLGLVGLALNTLGYRMESPARGSLVGYVEVPITYFFQVTVFHEHPNALAYGGVALVLINAILNSIEKYFEASNPGLSAPLKPTEEYIRVQKDIEPIQGNSEQCNSNSIPATKDEDE